MIKITYQRRTKLRGIYCIKNDINEKIYIGSSNHIMLRIFGGNSTSHINSLRKGNHINYHLQNAWNKYGEKNFSFNILELCNKEDNLFEKENYYLNSLLKADEYPKNKYFSRHGYNLCPTSQSVARKKYRDESIVKFSITKLGELNPMWGRRGASSPYSIPVLQYDKNGKLINYWKSIRDASDFYKIPIGSIHNSIFRNRKKGIKYTAGRYFWIQYLPDKNMDKFIKIERNRKPVSFGTNIEIIDVLTNEHFKFRTRKECAKFIKCGFNTIKRNYIKNRTIKKRFKVISYE